MKKYLFTVLLFAVSVGASAQMLSVVPRVGATVSTMSIVSHDPFPIPIFNSQNEVKSKIGFTLGAAINYTVSGMISIQPELNFIQKGYQEKSSSTDIVDFDGIIIETQNIANTTQTINYLEMPVLAKFQFGKSPQFFALIGPSIGIGLGGKFKSEEQTTENFNGDISTYSNSTKGKIKFGKTPEGYEGNDWYIDNRTDFGLQVGGGVLINYKIMIEARYGLGLSNLYDDSNYQAKNRVFQITIGMPLILK
ncbi:MAG: porin family protein [Cyclobacteriaceae bacterium]